MSSTNETEVATAAVPDRVFWEEAAYALERSRAVWEKTAYSENEVHCKFFSPSLTRY